jgi:hypothetical protein
MTRAQLSLSVHRSADLDFLIELELDHFLCFVRRDTGTGPTRYTVVTTSVVTLRK